MGEPGTWVRLVLAALAAWRVTHLLAHEDGPWDLVARLRMRLGHGFAGKLIDCFQCLSLWVAAPLALLVTRDPAELLLTWLAISGAACLLERVGEPPVLMQPMAPATQGVPSDGMLRSETIELHQPVRAGDDDGGSGHPARRAE